MSKGLWDFDSWTTGPRVIDHDSHEIRLFYSSFWPLSLHDEMMKSMMKWWTFRKLQWWNDEISWWIFGAFRKLQWWNDEISWWNDEISACFQKASMMNSANSWWSSIPSSFLSFLSRRKLFLPRGSLTNHGQVYCRVKNAYTVCFTLLMSLIVDNVLTISRRS